MATTDRTRGAVSSLAIKAPCRVATTANITLNGLQTIDGVTVVQDDRVLVKAQTTTANNGIYLADSGDWVRAPDFNGTGDVTNGTLISVNEGTSNVRSQWILSATNPIVIGTTALAFISIDTSALAGVSTVGASRAVTSGDYGSVLNCTATLTLTLASAVSLGSRWYTDISNQGTVGVVVTIDTTSSQLIDGMLTFQLYAGESVRLVSTGTAFVRIGHATVQQSSVIALSCKNNTGTPDSQWDISFNSVVLRHATNGSSFTYGTGTTRTNNVSTAGPIANGRDQAGVFSANSWIHFFLIFGNGALASLSSTSDTAPTLPTGYTHFAYVGAVRFNGSSVLRRTYILGDTAYYTEEHTLSTFTATVETAVSTAAAVPPNASAACIVAQAPTLTADGAGAATATLAIRIVTGTLYTYLVNFSLTGLGLSAGVRVAGGMAHWIPNLSQSFFAIWTVTVGSAQTTPINVLAYKLPILAC